MGPAREGRRGDGTSSVANILVFRRVAAGASGELPCSGKVTAATTGPLAPSSRLLAENGQAGSTVQRRPEGATAADSTPCPFAYILFC